MKGSSRKSDRIVKVISFTLLFIFAIAFLVPIIWIFLTSFKVDAEIYQAGGFMFFPKTWTLENFKLLLDPNNKQTPIFKWFINSFLVSGTHTLLAILLFSTSGYAYAKMQFKGKNIIFLTMLFMSTFPQITNMIPLYKLMLNFGWLNTPLALIFPGLAGVINIFLIRQFLYSIPDAIIESARIDGANEWTVFTKFILPMAKPILLVVGLFVFTASWNDFLWPSIAISNVDRLTLTAGLQLVKSAYLTYPGKISAVAVVAIVPMVVLYLFTHKYFINGVSLQSGVKE